MERFREHSTTLEKVNKELAQFMSESSWESNKPSPTRDQEGGAATTGHAPLWNKTTTHEASRSARSAPSFSDFIDMLNFREPPQRKG